MFLIGRSSKDRSHFFWATDYRRRLLYRVFLIAILLIILSIPLVRYFMAVFEGREINTSQALIFIMQTITTTGYGELLPFQSVHMKGLAIILMVLGVFLIFMIAGSIMATFIESRIIPRAPTYTKQKEHVVFTSYNNVVERTIKLLEHHDIPYIVASESQQKAVELIGRGLNCVCADPKHDEGIRNLGIDDARLVVTNNEDTININIILGISTMTNTPVLAVMENEIRAELAYAAGAKHVVTIEETLGQQLVDWICANASPTEFLKLLDVDVSSKIIEQLKPSIIHIGIHDEFSQKTIGELKIRNVTGATIVAIWNEDGTISPPSADTKLEESTLIVLGPHDNVDCLASYMGGPGPEGHVILVGAGRVGQEAGKMLNHAGIYPEVIDILDRPLIFEGRLIVGDATKPSVLKQAKVENADTLIVTINNDSLNIFTALASSQLNPDIDIVARAVHPDVVDRLHQAGANHVLSESILGLQLLQVALVDMEVLPKLPNYVIREIIWIKEPISIRNLAKTYEDKVEEIKIICVVRNEEILEPSADFILRKDDHVIVMGAPADVSKLFD